MAISAQVPRGVSYNHSTGSAIDWYDDADSEHRWQPRQVRSPECFGSNMVPSVPSSTSSLLPRGLTPSAGGKARDVDDLPRFGAGLASPCAALGAARDAADRFLGIVSFIVIPPDEGTEHDYCWCTVQLEAKTADEVVTEGAQLSRRTT